MYMLAGSTTYQHPHFDDASKASDVEAPNEVDYVNVISLQSEAVQLEKEKERASMRKPQPNNEPLSVLLVHGALTANPAQQQQSAAIFVTAHSARESSATHAVPQSAIGYISGSGAPEPFDEIPPPEEDSFEVGRVPGSPNRYSMVLSGREFNL
jgi:hypothetical protein